MPIQWDAREHIRLARYVLKWLLIAAPVSALVGSAVALFLWLLERATATRLDHPWLLYLLPLGGILIALVYERAGKDVAAGNNLIMDQIHEPGGGVPWTMAPLVLAGTVATHLFGGSAGREGTAIQMGGSIAQVFARPFGLSREDVRTLLTCGVAAGFGAVFGTPLTGAVFALEVLALGRMRYNALIPCLISSVVADLACRAWGIHHTAYQIAAEDFPPAAAMLRPSLVLSGKIMLAAVAFGLASVLFAELCHSLSGGFKALLPRAPWLRPVVGAVLVIGITWMLGTRAYLGLGVYPQDATGISILGAFQVNGVTGWSWLWKILLTAITLSSGFKGGEVTPLFFVGAALGHTMGVLLGVPVDLMAGLGFVAVFAGATNTPLACTIMGAELFGSQYLIYFAIACFLSYLFSGHSGIYLSQRIGSPKGEGDTLNDADSLRSIRSGRRFTWRCFGMEG